jgi:eukaryotic-like serine/threonine-protein kinase
MGSAVEAMAYERRPGDMIAGRYVLQRKLGQGGIGEVWVARSTALDVDVALKMLKPETVGPSAIERMAREARAVAQLGHPAMVRAFDFGSTERGEPFLAMELLQGEELSALLARKGRLPATRAAALLLPVIDGLGTAHSMGIVHRDVKPENIFISSDGPGREQPKLLDFGVAKLEQLSSALTHAGAVIGSPYYLSPEQAEGRHDVDFRSDVWSIGVVLYELVTGAPPFVADNYNALIQLIRKAPPKPPAELAGDPQLWSIIECCLRKQPEKRWASMWELGEALALWLYERGVRVDAAARSLRHGWLDAGITGLQIIVTSDAPDALDAATLPPPHANREADRGGLCLEPTLTVVTAAPRSSAPTGQKLGTWVAVAGAVALLTAASLFAWRQGRARAIVPGPPLAATLSPRPAPLPPVAAPLTPPATTPLASHAARLPAVAEPAAPAATAPRQITPPKVTSKPQKPAARRTDHEFGF